MLQVGRAGGRVGILPDQRVQEREGILVPFFGHPALTTPVLARLSLRDGCPVVPVFAYPQPGGRYRLVIRPPILPEEAGATEADSPGVGHAGASGEIGTGEGDTATAVAALTRRYLEVIEREIRDHPAMWLWMHRRWDRPGVATGPKESRQNNLTNL
jgi:KDO2-lipid IV(A) lauroyltransferase